MKIPSKLLTIILLITAISTYGQSKTEEFEKLPYIEVIGYAEKEVIPDEIYIRIIIQEKTVNRIKISIDEQEKKLKEAIKSLGIDLSNLYLSDINADYVKVTWKKMDVITYKDYTLKVGDATTVGKVFQELDKLEIANAQISKVNHSKIDSLQKEARINAIKNAKNKADYLLDAIGEKTDKPLIITDKDINNTMTYIDGVKVIGSSSLPKSSIDNGDIIFSDLEIQFKKIKIQSSIYVKFSIK